MKRSIIPIIVSCLCVAACNRATQPPQAEQVAPPAPPSAASDEVTYRGSGTEPFWGLSVTRRELRVNYPEPEPSVGSAYTVEERADGRTYRGSALSAVVTFKSCSDGMSDRVYPHTVKVQVGERTLNGCGWPAGHDLGPAP